MNKNELIDTIARNCSIRSSTVKAVIDEEIRIIKDTLADGKRVTIINFGSFESVKKEGYSKLSYDFQEKNLNVVEVPVRRRAKFFQSKKFFSD